MPGFSVGQGTETNQPPANVEFFRQHRWSIIKLGPITVPTINNLYARDLQIPDMDLQTEEIKGGFLTYKYASGVNYGDATVSFYDTQNLLSELKKWQDQVFTLTEGIKQSSNYKSECIFRLEDGSESALQTFTLKNSFIKNISHGPLTMTASEVKYITLTISCDYYEFS